MRSLSGTPTIPTDAIYTKFYCEENIYLLARSFLPVADLWDINAVFISNKTRSVALWNQRAANPVVWDYHVVLVLRPKCMDAGLVYDFDTTLDCPCTTNQYIAETFPYELSIDPLYRSLFRIVSCEEFLANFASDRSHMKIGITNAESAYKSPCPPYPPIQGPLSAETNTTNNLMSEFVDMNAKRFGMVSDLLEFMNWCNSVP